MLSRINSLAVLLLAGTAAASNPFEAKQSSNSAQAAYVNKLVLGARPTKNSQLGRNLADNNNANGADISSYSVKFIKCQFVKGFSDDLAEDNDATTVLYTNRFVVFRLCPYQSCYACNSGYGEYLIDMENYLTATVEYRQEEQKAMCNTCAECAVDDAAADANRRLADVDCSTCSDTCDKIENMEANGYIDATAFINCQQLVAADEDAGTSAFYAGAMCASSGSKIKIGVFSDEYCMNFEENLDVESYLADENGNAMKLSHALLRTVYDDDDCISCANVDENADADADAAAEVNDVCASLYSYAAKCETLHGFTSGLDAYDENYANQLAQEDVVCDFIYSLQSGTYNQTGDIVVGGTSFMSEGGSSTTGGQKFALTFFILGTVGLAVYAAMLHSQLIKDSKTHLSAQGGAMA